VVLLVVEVEVVQTALAKQVVVILYVSALDSLLVEVEVPLRKVLVVVPMAEEGAVLVIDDCMDRSHRLVFVSRLWAVAGAQMVYCD
jgi:hypothetical protein